MIDHGTAQVIYSCIVAAGVIGGLGLVLSLERRKKKPGSAFGRADDPSETAGLGIVGQEASDAERSERLPT